MSTVHEKVIEMQKIVGPVASGALAMVKDNDRVEAVEHNILVQSPTTTEEAVAILTVAASWLGCDLAPEMQAEARAAIKRVVAFLGGAPSGIGQYYGVA